MIAKTGMRWRTNGAELLFSPQFVCFVLFLERAQHYCDRGIHLKYANSWQRICLLVLDLPLGGRSPTQLRSLSAVCLQTPVILPHSTTLRQSHFSPSHPRCVCLDAVRTGWGQPVGGGGDDDKWWGSWKCITACRFITTVLKTFSTKTVQDKIISISAGEEAFSSIHSLSWQLRDLLRSFQLHSIIWAQLELLIQCFIISVTAIRMILILLCKLHFSQITAVFQLPEEMCFYLVALKQETVEIMNTLENSSLF